MSPRQCPLCAAPWQEAATSLPCSFCGTREPAEFCCPNGHYVCEACRTDDPRDVVLRVCNQTKAIDPQALWDLVSSHGAFRGHGPQFHFALVPVIAAVLRNRGVQVIPADGLRQTVTRLSEIPALSCAEIGVCGAGANAGALLSLLTGATPLSDRERRLALSASGRALAAIADHPGGRCCRQSVLATLGTLWECLRADLGIPLEAIRPRCRHSARIPDCKPGCAYHE